jgi:hypothetical protein
MAFTPTTQWQELARRFGNGVEVALLWNERVNLVKVAVSDGRLCHHVDLEVADERALSAFHQPFADAATRMWANGASDEFWGFKPSLRKTANEEGQSA